MSLFNLIAGDPKPVEPNGGGLLDKLLAMPTSSDSAVQSPTPIMASGGAPGDNLPPVGDLWKPTHRNLLGRIADAMIMAHGGKPVYEERMKERDLTSAMQGFDPNNPTPTIQRIAQIPGMADQAYKMYEQYGTDQERNQSRGIRDAAKKDLITQRLSGIAAITTPKNFDASRQFMLDYIKRWGENPDDYDIPSSYDKDKLDFLSNGAISAKDQQAQAAREQALALRGQAIDNTDQYRQARLGQIDTAEGDRNSRFQQGQAGVQDRFNTNQARLVGKGSHQTLMTKYGPGILSPDGNQMIVTNPKQGGRQYGYVKAGDQWVPVGETAASKKAHGE